MTRSSFLVSSLLVVLALAGCAEDIKGDCTEVVGTGLFPELKNTCLDTGIIDSGETGDSAPDTDSAETGETGDDTATPIDADNDGFTAADDCDDGNPAINPDATEICDGVDNNCDGDVDGDATDQTTFYADEDEDGYGNAAVTIDDCSAPAGYVADSTDCEDDDATVHPYADEDCSATKDLNCDESFGYADADADLVPACEDCDDTNAAAYPGNTETCDGVDNDCEGTVDEDATDEITWYADSDSDSYGNPDSTTTSCDEPTGYVADSTDCDDTAATAYPGGTEVCDELNVDENCDGTAEADDSIGATQWKADDDGDGFGDPSVTVSQCDAPPGYVTTASGYEDCDDSDPAVNVDATEACNGYDDDCDDDIDESGSTGESTWHADNDEDGYGDASDSQLACDTPPKYVADATDCDDTTSTSYPGAPETCDGADNDCDSSTDEDAVDALTWYADSDADSYGDASATTEDCSAPAGYVSISTDCDDGDSGVNPGEAEVCDSVDNDCDSSTDEGLGSTYYLDADADGYGDSSETASGCAGVPTGYVVNSTDCDDGDSGVNPGEAEVCDSVDNDCDGSTDEGVTSEFFLDDDGDGFGDPDVWEDACSASSGYVSDDTDCDDDRAELNPAETQDCYSGLDQDCDGDVSYSDTDCGFGSFSSENLFTTGGSWNGEGAAGVGSIGNWVAASGSAPSYSCATAYDDSCALVFTGPGSWLVTSDNISSSSTESIACVFSVASSAASTTVSYTIGSVSASTTAGNAGWHSEVPSYFTRTGAVTLQVTITTADTLYLDSVICVQ